MGAVGFEGGGVGIVGGGGVWVCPFGPFAISLGDLLQLSDDGKTKSFTPHVCYFLVIVILIPVLILISVKFVALLCLGFEEETESAAFLRL